MTPETGLELKLEATATKYLSDAHVNDFVDVHVFANFTLKKPYELVSMEKFCYTNSAEQAYISIVFPKYYSHIVDVFENLWYSR